MNYDKTPTGSILRIERSSIHDGQGLRTVLFLKGCPLRCQWCSTPESQSHQPQKGFAHDRCSGCGTCVRFCPHGALTLINGKAHTDKALCKLCFTCVAKCPARAHKQYGQPMTVLQAVREIAKDEIFFFHSAGGVTISGGEPLTQTAFVAAVLRQCKERGIHTAMETSFSAPFEKIERVLPWLDVLYVDIKQMDPRLHKVLTGADNTLILDNIRKTAESVYPLEIIIRIPLIPGLNDTDANLAAIALFSRSIGKLKEVELLPYHRLGQETYRHLDLDYPLLGIRPPSQDQIVERAEFLARQNPGVPVRAGGGFIGRETRITRVQGTEVNR